MNRLKLVEALAKALKEAGISDDELTTYITWQKVLNKSGISIDTFVSIVDKAEALTWQDQGKGLLKDLSDYGGLDKTSKELQNQVKLLEKQADGLEELAQQKGKLVTEVGELKSDRATLEGIIAGLQDQKAKLEQVQSELALLPGKKAALESEITQLEEKNANLNQAIKAKEQKIADMGRLEARQNELAAANAKIESKLKQESSHLQVFDSFLGLVKATSMVELKQFVATIPDLLAQAELGQYSPDLLRAYIVKSLTGPNLRVFRCASCGVWFTADQPAKGPLGYHCPVCSLSTVLDEIAVDVLKEALAKSTQLVNAIPIKVAKVSGPDSGAGAGG